MRHVAFVLAFNAELTLRACLENLRGLFDEVIVVEGAVGPDDPWTHHTDLFTKDGRSTDATLRIAREAGAVVITTEGFWKDKTEMCNAALDAAGGRPFWAWQIDADEFFHRSDVVVLKDLLSHNPLTARVDFWAYHFWGGLGHVTDPKEQIWANQEGWRRIFRIEDGVRFLKHEPPTTSLDGPVIGRDLTESLGVRMFHYGYFKREQAERKAIMYNAPQLLEAWETWRTTGKAYSGAPVVPFQGRLPVTL